MNILQRPESLIFLASLTSAWLASTACMTRYVDAHEGHGAVFGSTGEARNSEQFIRPGEEYRDSSQGHINLLGLNEVIQPIRSPADEASLRARLIEQQEFYRAQGRFETLDDRRRFIELFEQAIAKLER